MQAINVTIVNPLFLAAFLGTALATATLAVTALLRLSTPGMPLLLAGSALFLLGAFGVTMIFNGPLNNQLAVQDPNTAAAAQFWLGYVSRWMVWNHVRTDASLAAAAFLILGVYHSRYGSSVSRSSLLKAARRLLSAWMTASARYRLVFLEIQDLLLRSVAGDGRLAKAGRAWPIRCARSIAWASTAAR